jgi:hypothetical protein
MLGACTIALESNSTSTGLEQLKAFVVSGTGKGHRIEVHVSRTSRQNVSASNGCEASEAFG